MTSTVHKVTCFITHRVSQNTELLLFRHPNAGIQIPAGTAEPDETPEVAAWREAAEESGLTGLELKCLLGEEDEPPPPGQALGALPQRDTSESIKAG